jgi:drug/metabolite transporter (DMT)-like permease
LRCWLPQGCTGATLALSLAALFWAGNFVAGRALRDDADPVTLNVLRWLLCLALLLPLVGRSLLRHWPVVRREWRLVLGLGATGIAAFHTLVYLALVETTAVNALLIVTLAPITIMAGAAAIGQERPSWVQWLGTLVSLVGAFVLVTRGSLETLPTLDLNKGDLWMLGAILAWAIYSLLLRRRPRDLPQDVTLAASIIAALGLLLPILLLQGAARFNATPATLGALAYIAVFASLIAFLLWSYGVDQIGAAQAGQFVNLMPVFGALLAVLLLGERIAGSQVVGAAFVFGGMVLVQRRHRAARG